VDEDISLTTAQLIVALKALASLCCPVLGFSEIMVRLHTAAAMCSLIAFIFFLIGCIGNSEGKETIRDIPWAIGTVKIKGRPSDKVFFGTSAYFYDSSGEVQTYNDCKLDICKTCKDAGSTAIGLTATAVVLTIIALAINCVQTCGAKSLTNKHSSVTKVVAIFCAFVAAVLAIFAFCIFDDCLSDFVDYFDGVQFIESVSVVYGAAAVLVITGCCLMALAVFLNYMATANKIDNSNPY
jgi:uncharacterized membrane protein YidH (DUF202 family)